MWVRQNLSLALSALLLVLRPFNARAGEKGAPPHRVAALEAACHSCTVRNVGRGYSLDNDVALSNCPSALPSCA